MRLILFWFDFGWFVSIEWSWQMAKCPFHCNCLKCQIDHFWADDGDVIEWQVPILCQDSLSLCCSAASVGPQGAPSTKRWITAVPGPCGGCSNLLPAAAVHGVQKPIWRSTQRALHTSFRFKKGKWENVDRGKSGIISRMSSQQSQGPSSEKHWVLWQIRSLPTHNQLSEPVELPAEKIQIPVRAWCH